MELMRLYSTDLRSASDTLLDLGTSSFRWKNLYLSGTMSGVQAFSSTIISCSSMDAVVVTAQSSTILYSAGSTISLNNGTNACINTPILIGNPVKVSGNFWFFSSSNLMYLAVVSNNATYYVAMAT